MLLADILFLSILVYLAYRFIFNFLLPIVRATHQFRQQFRNGFGGSQRGGDFRAQGSGGNDPEGAPRGSAAAGTRSGSGGGSGTAGTGGGKGTYKPPAEDYIDFEEVK
jgi:hypothetical protein